MDFAQLTLRDWQQFEQIDIVFHPRATILTGANGSGKTTILSLLARHIGWHHSSLATPKNDRATKLLRYFSLFRFFTENTTDDRIIGSLAYTDGNAATLRVPEAAGAQYQVEIHNQQHARFFYIPSHRQTFIYRRVDQINTQKKERQAAFHEVQGTHMNRYAGNGGDSSSYLMKSTLLGWVINGYGVRSATKTIMQPDPQQIENFEGFRDALRLVLPPTLGFEDLEVRDSEIVFICNGGADEFLLETASGGISALIDMAWQIYMFDNDINEPFAVVIDEIENHLHPSMQRNLLPNLLAAFPNAKFIVSTHSPLIVTSVEDASVYVLSYGTSKKVNSTLLDFKREVKNAIDVLDEVLGVSTTIPAWAEKRLLSILESHEQNDPTPESLAQLRSDMTNAGLGRLFPDAIISIAEARK